MISFRVWLENFNQPLQLTTPIAEIRNLLNRSYKKEMVLQSKYGSTINHPDSVLINKIRHNFTNYEEVQNDIEHSLAMKAIDCCQALQLRLQLNDEIFELTNQVINTLPKIIRPAGNLQILRTELIFRNNEIKFNKARLLNLELTKQGCGNCGGERSSQRNFRLTHSWQ